MIRIAPVTLAFNPKVLWFEAGDLVVGPQDKVVVSTARGTELGSMAGEVFDASDESVGQLASPLKPVKRVATEYDLEQAARMEEKSKEALPLFKRLVEESGMDMNPVSVEYLLDGDKAVFYFESEERVDFRELVRSLAAELHIRIDMRQIGVRDEARMIGGLSHCGQELCCKRLGGEFNPVTIRMAKEQNLSLNPQKISGVCGRLMCCLRYEYEAYRDFNGRAPKLKAKVKTPDGIATVVELDAVREMVSLQISDEKPIRVPLADFDEPREGARPDCVGEDAWERAHDASMFRGANALSFFSHSSLEDSRLADAKAVVRRPSAGKAEEGRSSARRSAGVEGEPASHAGSSSHSRKRRRSTMLAFGDEEAGSRQTKAEAGAQKPTRERGGSRTEAGKRSVVAEKGEGAPSPADEKRQGGRRVRMQRKSEGVVSGESEKQPARNAQKSKGEKKAGQAQKDSQVKASRQRGKASAAAKPANRELSKQVEQAAGKQQGKRGASSLPASAGSTRPSSAAPKGSVRPGRRSSGLSQGQAKGVADGEDAGRARNLALVEGAGREKAKRRSVSISSASSKPSSPKKQASQPSRRDSQSAVEHRASEGNPVRKGASEAQSRAPEEQSGRKRRSRNRSHLSNGAAGTSPE